MSVESYEQQILKAVDILTEGAIKDLKFDKTILATVESIQDISIGEHKVRFQDGTFSAFSSSPGLYYTPGSLVYVQVPQGDFSERKIILSGKTTLPNNELAEQINDFIENKYPEDAKAWIQSWWTPSDEDPADSWTDSSAVHEGDFWYQTDTNNYFRYTLGEGGIYQWEIIQGINAVSGFLTNENHTVAAAADGTVVDGVILGAGGTFKVYNGVDDVTGSATLSVSGGNGTTSITKEQNGLTLTLIETTGIYTLTASSWTSNSETFTLNALYNGVTVSKTYTITKSLAGADAEIYELEINPINLIRGKDGVLSPSSLTLSATKTVGNGTPEDYVGSFKIYEDGVINPSGPFAPVSPATSINYTPTTSTVNQIQIELYDSEGITLLDTQSVGVINDATGGNLLYSEEWEDTAGSEINTATFEHWQATNIDLDGINNNQIQLFLSPYNNFVPHWVISAGNSLASAEGASENFTINNKYIYRFSIWFKKIMSENNINDGTIYLKTSNTLNIDGTAGDNLFIELNDDLISNEWYLFIGHVYPYSLIADSGVENVDFSSGIYTIEGEKIQGFSTKDLKWGEDTNTSNFIFGFGENTDGEEQKVYFYAPRVEIKNGQELPLDAFFPTLQIISDTYTNFQNNFQELDDDGVISSVEKRALYELFKQLVNEKDILINKASKYQSSLGSTMTSFQNSFEVFSTYLTGTFFSDGNPEASTEESYGLSLFHDMQTSTILPYLYDNGSYFYYSYETDDTIIKTPKELWESKWTNYYEAKQDLEVALVNAEIAQFNDQEEVIGEITSWRANAEGILESITNIITFDTSGLKINIADQSNFYSLLNNKHLSFIDENTSASVLELDAVTSTITSKKAKIRESMDIANHSISKVDNYTVIKYIG